MTELHEPQAQRGENAHGQQAIDEDVAPENGVQEIDDSVHGGALALVGR